MQVTLSMNSTKDRFIIEAPAVFKNLVDTIPGRHYDNKARKWDAPLTYPVYLTLWGTFGERLQIGDDVTEWLTDIYFNVIAKSLQLRDLPAAEGYHDLYPHQNADVLFLTNIRRGLLANGLGSGKTRSAVASMRRLYELGEQPFPALVVCPNSTKIAWKREIEAVWPQLRVVVVGGSVTQRRKAFKEFVGTDPCLVHNPPETISRRVKRNLSVLVRLTF